MWAFWFLPPGIFFYSLFNFTNDFFPTQLKADIFVKTDVFKIFVSKVFRQKWPWISSTSSIEANNKELRNLHCDVTNIYWALKWDIQPSMIIICSYWSQLIPDRWGDWLSDSQLIDNEVIGPYLCEFSQSLEGSRQAISSS